MKQSILITGLMLGTILRSVKNQIMNNVVMPAIFIAVTFLPIGEVGGQTVEVELQRSADMEDWETVAITPDLLSEKGTVRQPAGENAGFFRLRIKSVEEAPSGMALIPAGSFTMGDTFNEGYSDERPVHTVNVSAFYMDRYEVTKALWDDVRAWAVNNGYTDLPAGDGKVANHPVYTGSWYDVVKWCNARSEKEGRTPAYYTSAAETAVYRTGEVDVENDWVKWDTGYRLPTEAEWEKAARGGLSGRRFPWGDTDNITHSRANYDSSSNYAYDTSSTRGYHPTFETGGYTYSSPVGYFEANAYGLYDMAGNAWEWCWDWFSLSYYSSSPETDPRGPTSGLLRVVRGGGGGTSWVDGAFGCRAASRISDYPVVGRVSPGFRCARASGQ